MVQTSSGGWAIIEITSNGDLDDGPTNIFEAARLALGLEETEFNLLLIGIATAILVILISLLVGTVRQGFSNMRDRKRSASVVIEADPEDALEIDQDEVEEVAPRVITSQPEFVVETKPVPPPPTDPTNPYRTVMCSVCHARFELFKEIRKNTCPSCGSG